ncbi:MAG: GNAT family N-acetyltransferase [Bacteroidota bacterium]
MNVLQPQTPEEFERYYRLRWELLRKPWGWERGSELTDDEDRCVHAMICDDQQNALAVCRLQMNSAEEAQVRFMAVRDDVQGKGLGRIIMSYMEDRAREKGAKKMVLQARENALEFYKRMNYTIVKKTHLLWGVIQHYLMEKEL